MKKNNKKNWRDNFMFLMFFCGSSTAHIFIRKKFQLGVFSGQSMIDDDERRFDDDINFVN